MALKIDLKYGDDDIVSLNTLGTTSLLTNGKVLDENIIVDVVSNTEDATATADKILSSYTAYIADGSKATGSISTWEGEKKTTIDCLCLELSGHDYAGTTIGMVLQYGPSLREDLDIKYSLDGYHWNTFIPETTQLTLGSSSGISKVYFKGNNPNGFNLKNSIVRFNFTNTVSGSRINASGNIMSLIDNGSCDTTTIPSAWCFANLFQYCTILATAPELPATTLADFCYEQMF